MDEIWVIALVLGGVLFYEYQSSTSRCPYPSGGRWSGPSGGPPPPGAGGGPPQGPPVITHSPSSFRGCDGNDASGLNGPGSGV